MAKQKKWFFMTLGGSAAGLLLILVVMVLLDPFFHYHGMLEGLSYRIYNERYINSGIVKNFEYDAIITGTSMTQNFKKTQFDELFGVNSVKVPFSGAGFREVRENLDRAFSSNNDIKVVLLGVDYNGLYREGYWRGYEEYPEYLYDDNLLNDVSYVWNKELIFQGLVTNVLMTLRGEPTTTFDEYSSWEGGRGLDSIYLSYTRREEIAPMKKEKLTQKDRHLVTYNLETNYLKVIEEHPETKFILFYTPYSAAYWDSVYRDGTLQRQISCEKLATKRFLEYDNVELYSFARKTEITENLELYRDKEHYVAEVNDMILQWIANGEGRVTKDNYEDLIQWEREYYSEFDYDSLYP